MEANPDQLIDECSAVLRILDANANRAVEGLRAVEDYARFALDDRNLSQQCKQIRHDLSGVVSEVCPPTERLRARNTDADVGTDITVPKEYHRESMAAAVRANLQRCQQALRCLEEYSKVLGRTDGAVRIEKIRYRVYSLEKSLGLTAANASRLADVQLYVLIDGGSSPQAFDDLAATLIAAGVHALQLRDKRLSDRDLVCRARRLRELTRGTQVLFIVNDRPDIAALADADGVHVGQEELSAKDARTVVGPRRLVGVSTHSLDQARQAVADGADYLGCGPTFPSGTKSFRGFPGLGFLREVAREIRLPAFAIGGISEDNLPQVLECGMSKIAVAGAVAAAPDPGQAARRLLELLRGTAKK